MAKKINDTKFVTNKVRLCYVNLVKPRANDEGKLRYDVMLLIPKSDKETIKLFRACEEAAKQIGKTKLWGGKLPPKLTSVLRDGDTEKDTDEQPEFAGHWFLNAGAYSKPGIVDRNREPIDDTTEIYSGMYARVSLNLYPFDQKGNKGVGAGLENVQKLADGEPLGGGRSRPEDDFDDDVEDDDDDYLN